MRNVGTKYLASEKSSVFSKVVVMNLTCSWQGIQLTVRITKLITERRKSLLIFITGVYRRNENLKHFIDITGVETLRAHNIGSELVLGANVSLSETMEILTKASSGTGFEYCKYLVDHIDLIANVPVRNVSYFAIVHSCV